MWLLLQMSVMITVLCANIYYQLTPNGVLAGLLAISAAWIVTKTVVAAMGLARRVASRPIRARRRSTPPCRS
jgi:hypothetical protein